MARRALLIALPLLSGVLVLGHDMWLESSSFVVNPGQEVTIRTGNGTIYQKSENAVSPDRIAALLAVGPRNQRLQPGEPRVEGHWLDLAFKPEKPGNYWIGLATKPRKISLSGKDFNGYLEHDGIPQVLEQRKRDGILERDEVEQYSKYVKIYLQAGKRRSHNYARPLGLDIEIVPLKNPYKLKVGQDLPVRVLFEGRPLANFALHAGYAGQTEEGVHEVTGAKGEAIVPLSAPGRWYLRGIHLQRVDQPEYSYESKWATLTFEVGK